MQLWQLWQLDIVHGPRLLDVTTGEFRDARIVTGVDDHSRYCVLARVMERATGRAVCVAFSEALTRHGAPEEVLTDNGQQFTARFSGGGEVLFDKDLPPQRHHAPTNSAQIADHDWEDRALSSDPARRVAQRRGPVRISARGAGCAG